MSTKVYEAYHLKDGVDIWGFAHATYRKALPKVKEKVWELAMNVIANHSTPEERREFFAKLYEREPSAVTEDMLQRQLTPMDATDYIRREYGRQLTSPFRNPYNLDVSLAFRQHEGGVYLIPHVGEGMRGVLGFLKKGLKKKDSQVEDFCYWNNVDEPEGMDIEEWEARGRVWDELDKDWQFMLVLEVMSYNGFGYINPAWERKYQAKWKEMKK